MITNVGFTRAFNFYFLLVTYSCLLDLEPISTNLTSQNALGHHLRLLLDCIQESPLIRLNCLQVQDQVLKLKPLLVIKGDS